VNWTDILTQALLAVLNYFGITEFFESLTGIRLPDEFNKLTDVVNNDYDKLKLLVATNNVPALGVSAQVSNLDTALQNDTDTITSLLNGHPTVTLPSPPPVEYQPTTPTQNWDEPGDLEDPIQNPYDPTAAVRLTEAAEGSEWATFTNGWLARTRHDFSLCASRANWGAIYLKQNLSGAAYEPPPVIDWTLWTLGTSLVDFLNAHDDVFTWEAMGDGRGNDNVCYALIAQDEFLDIRWRCNVAPWELPFRSGKWVDVLSASLPHGPVYPGSANVTLGTPADITPSLLVDGPMDGCLVNVTDYPSRITPWTFGTKLSIRGLGFVAFLTDDGFAEPQQKVLCPTSLITPTAMVRAGACAFQFMSGVTGTVTPYVNTGAP